MPPSSIDHSGPNGTFNTVLLERHTCAWLLLPVLAFMAGWMHWYISLPAAALLMWGIIKGARSSAPARDGMPEQAPFPLFTRQSLCVLAAFIVVMIFSGWGGWVNQHPDHIVRNACLQELVSSPWPVVFPDGDVLIYNIGFWIIPALAGKLTGLDAARILLPLWGAWGFFLTWCWICVFSGRRSAVFALLLIMFGSLLNLQCWLSLDLFRLHYFGIAEQIMCSANASIPVVRFFVWLAASRMPPGWLLPLFSCMAFYSPLAAVGGLPLIVCEGIREWKARRNGQAVWSVPAVLAAAIPGICFLIYYGHVNAPSSRMGLRPFYTGWGDFLLIGTSFLAYALFCWRDFRRNPLFLCTLATGLLLPFLYVNGDVNDLLCKGSVPAMACLLAFLARTYALHPSLRLWIWILLLLGLAPRFNLPYYFSAPEPVLLHLKNLPAPDGWAARELRKLILAEHACIQDGWKGTMYHPGHRWHPYYSGSPGWWYRLVFR